MEIGIDSFIATGAYEGPLNPQENVAAMEALLSKIEFADHAGLHVFGLGEHHRKEFLDEAPAVILAAAAARTKNIRLTSAVTVLSAADPVRVFQEYATLDIISKGRAEIVAGRGSFIDAFPLFGLNTNDYDALFDEKIQLLLNLRANETVTWKGKFRPALNAQPVYPRPLQEPLPVWIGVGGTPQSFARAGTLGLPLMVAVIGGETHRFRQLIDLYYQAGEMAGHKRDKLKVGLHSLGFVAETTQDAKDIYFPGYQEMMGKIGKERGWSTPTRPMFEAQAAPLGAYVVGSPEEVAEKILRHSEALGGISRFTFQMDNPGLSKEQVYRSIELIGTKVIPLINK
ncbi:Atu2307/SP_0267 family LLM class monooxygenase [Paraflavitalea sp. CAU 1676]|uniref:Atu2307/SP_0267 family LLM class monooxygenase n=1 Tax=Paraflavitalea sp. CAU 1676 TaxID=3032598 RepID=UPI0023DA0B75|nr:Atu2307/SP_0267 family LLM class monooxygenase [Paraflavitalea sp. CAU 1676]MDF2192084.1 LLM class flavin-dependent oxidoreductase [Paraflavitalea sp. CAU 1676]